MTAQPAAAAIALFLDKIRGYEPGLGLYIEKIVEESTPVEQLRQSLCVARPWEKLSAFSRSPVWSNYSLANILATPPKQLRELGTVLVNINGPRFSPYYNQTIAFKLRNINHHGPWVDVELPHGLCHPNVNGPRLIYLFFPYLGLLPFGAALMAVCTRLSGLLSRPQPSPLELEHSERDCESTAFRMWMAVHDAGESMLLYHQYVFSQAQPPEAQMTPDHEPRPIEHGRFLPVTVQVLMPHNGCLHELRGATTVRSVVQFVSSTYRYPQPMIAVLHEGGYIGIDFHGKQPLRALGVADNNLLTIDLLHGEPSAPPEVFGSALMPQDGQSFNTQHHL